MMVKVKKWSYSGSGFPSLATPVLIYDSRETCKVLGPFASSVPIVQPEKVTEGKFQVMGRPTLFSDH